MGRPPAHSADDFLDAAVALFATGGARAVTMSAVARAVGAPSGSVYHRFPDRPGLLAAVWLRTVRRFQRGFFVAIDARPAVEAAVAGASFTVDWCRSNMDEAVVLYAGKRAFGAESWPPDAGREVAANDEELQRRIRGLVSALVEATGRETEEVVLAAIDLPYAAVRRYLERGMPPPSHVTELVGRSVRTLLGPGAGTGQ